jgi:hypothetical protein
MCSLFPWQHGISYLFSYYFFILRKSYILIMLGQEFKIRYLGIGIGILETCEKFKKQKKFWIKPWTSLPHTHSVKMAIIRSTWILERFMGWNVGHHFDLKRYFMNPSFNSSPSVSCIVIITMVPGEFLTGKFSVTAGNSLLQKILCKWILCQKYSTNVTNDCLAFFSLCQNGIFFD